MWNEPNKETLKSIPKLYETEHTPLKDKLIYAHFFLGGNDWYVCETDGSDCFWGFVIGREVKEIRCGDLVFFMLFGKSSHVGIYLGKGNFVHSSKSKGVAVSSLDSKLWKQHLITSRRVKQPIN